MYNAVARGVDRSLLERVVREYSGKWVRVTGEPRHLSYNIIVSKCSGQPVLANPSTVEVCTASETPESVLKSIELGELF